MSWVIELQSGSVGETLEIGRAIGAALTAGDVVGLVGCLGAGKTHLIKGIAHGLGVPEEGVVNSPTFILVNEYAGRVPVYHADAYRLRDVRELDGLGFDEMMSSGGVVLVEWADRIAAALGPQAVWIELSIVGETERRIGLSGEDEATRARLERTGLDRWGGGRGK